MSKSNKKSEFEKIAFEHINSLYNTALRLTKNPVEAEDLVQDTYLRAFRFFNKFQQGTNFKAWIFKILKNTFINKYRKIVRTPYHLNLEKVEYSLKQDERPSNNHWSGMDYNRYQALFDDDIASALSDLSDEFRTVVLLTDVEGFSYKETAEIIDRPIGTVMSRLSRGRKLLRQSLGNYAAYEGYVKSDSDKVLVEG